MNRLELLEILVKQGKRIEELEKELAETKAQLESREIRLQKAGSIADAALQLTDIFTRAQEAADLYLENVKANAGAGTAPGAGEQGNPGVSAGGTSSGVSAGAEDAEDDSVKAFSRTGIPSQQGEGAPGGRGEFPEKPDPAPGISAFSDSGNDEEEPEHWFEDAPEPESSPAVKGAHREPVPRENAAPEPRAEHLEAEPEFHAEYRETEPESRAEYTEFGPELRAGYRESGPETGRKRRYGEYEEEADENGFHWLDDI